MPFAVFRLYEDLSGGCPEEGCYPSADQFSIAEGPFKTRKEARARARDLAAGRRSNSSLSTFMVLEVFIAEPYTQEEEIERSIARMRETDPKGAEEWHREWQEEKRKAAEKSAVVTASITVPVAKSSRPRKSKQ